MTVAARRDREVSSEPRFSVIRTNSRRLNHVADGEPLNSLVLGGASRAVGASNGLDVAAA